ELADDPRLDIAAFEECLAWKGGIGRIERRARTTDGVADGRTSILVAEIHRAQRALARLALERSEIDAAEHAKRLEAHRARLNALEVEFRTASEGKPIASTASFDDMRAALPEGAAFVDFEVHARYRPQSPSESGEEQVLPVWSEP